VVEVPDKRLLEISEIVKPEKTTPTTIEFIDIAGLVRGAHKGEGLGNQFLAHIRNCDAILKVARAFKNPGVENVLGEINPEKEIEVVKLELLMKDLETVDSLLAKLTKKIDKKDLKRADLLNRLRDTISQGKSISELDLTPEERLEIKEYQFLTSKPVLYLFNTGDDIVLPSGGLKMNLKDEEEVSELSPEERKELQMDSHLDQIITYCYNILDLITFFTVAGLKEAKAWTVKRGSGVKTAAGRVHSDFEERFIKAQVISWDQFVKAGSWTKARELGWLKTAGKEYIVQDGDVIEFKI
jgi:ribosome-binding ATPase YchF (GTP1/OBG family)